MKGLRAFFTSMTGRIFLLLTGGMATAGLLAGSIALTTSDAEFERQLVERASDRVVAFITLLDGLTEPTRTKYLASGVSPIRADPPPVTGYSDVAVRQALAQRGGLFARATVEIIPASLCYPYLRKLPREQSRDLMNTSEVVGAIERIAPANPTPLRKVSPVRVYPARCRLITAPLSDGSTLRFALDAPRVEREISPLLNPAFLTLISAAAVLLAYLVARLASAPLAKLGGAAEELGQDLDRPPLPVTGPTEVQRAAAAFNAMQVRLQQHVAERTRMLAAITHDLQTPLTRMRLRLERVEDAATRERLVADLNAMKALIDEGLELARSADTSEPRVMLDLDSLLESIVADAADAGGNASFEKGCGAVLSVRPLAVRRLFSNLVDNALKYGGSARVYAERAGDRISVCVRDRGPGLPADMLERVFEPFVRLDDSRSRSTGGAGLGLTIARTLAEKNGATLTLRNHPEGGLEAKVLWP